jgi:hypothetical protein
MILLRKRDLIVPVRSVQRVRGRFKLEAVNQGDGRRRVLADWFPNLITNGGLDDWASGNDNWLLYCAVGSGNRAPADTDTALQTLVGSTSSTVSTSTGTQATAPYYGWTTYQYNFPAGTATGNLSEIGVGKATTALFSRALILDGTGAPTTITVLSNEALYATYQIQQYVPTADVVGNVTIAGVVYSYTVRAGNATEQYWEPQTSDAPVPVAAVVSNGAIGPITGNISGTSTAGGATYSSSAYTPGSYVQDSTITFGLTAGNVTGGITAMSVQFGSAFGNGNKGWFQYGFGTAIPKDGSHVLTLSVSNSWARG